MSKRWESRVESCTKNDVRQDSLPCGKGQDVVRHVNAVEHAKGGRKRIRFIDLFAGCGGLSEGFVQAGYSPVAHVEMNEAACFTLKTRMAYHWLKKNGKLADYCAYLRGKISRAEFYQMIPSQILDSVINEEVGEKTLKSLFKKIDAAKGNGAIDLIVGGPPCQAYSLVGRARKSMEGNPRNYLFRYYIEFLKHYKPKCFVFENVVGLLSAADKDGNKYLDMMIDGFKDAGYTTSYVTINTKTLGIPQARKRVIIIGVRGKKPSEEELLDDEGLKFFLEGGERGEIGKTESELLDAVNEPLKNTAFVVAYRFANEYALYEAALAKLKGVDLATAAEEDKKTLASEALDQVVLMKLLPRIHGERAAVKAIFEGTKETEGLKGKLPPDGMSATMMAQILSRSDEYLTFWP